ncbi:VOC family protein, partial [Allocoleopsis sp.]|uniref:VOC family protein n=1 Tax=Allocoleopsis sp. TaxID=3088169 RepID=UPI002FD3792E
IVDSSIQPKLQNHEKWGRNPHVALSVADLDAAKTQLLAQGYSLKMSDSGRTALFTQDPDGNIIELSQA